MEKRIAVILAGGKSRRFGSDKAFAKVGVGEKNSLEVLAGSLRESGFEILISTNHPQHSVFGFPILPDASPFQGPLSALLSVLQRSRAERILLTACDMPFLSSRLVELLWSEGKKSEVTLFASEEGPSPLPGIYSRSLLPSIQKKIALGERSLVSLLETGHTIKILKPELWSFADPARQVFKNINTPKDLVQESLFSF